MKYFGGLLLLAYAALQASGWQPSADDDRGEVPENVRHAPGGILTWTSGFMGGK
ncbi:MAG: hypothetical protein ACJ790_17245 [Myxococcaceae bacterium]